MSLELKVSVQLTGFGSVVVPVCFIQKFSEGNFWKSF